MSTALDLLSVLSAPTDPPDVDVNAIPLPQQTLTLVPTAPPPSPSTDPTTNPLAALPLASSLDALKSSANAFFRASEELIPLDDAELEAAGLSSSSPTRAPRPRTRDPDPWPTILRLHASSPRSLIPLGAMKGASLSGKGETRTAREVGVFFGCQEAKAEYRRAAVARVGELLQDEAEERRGRKMVFEFEEKGDKTRFTWDGLVDGDEERVEKILRSRSRAAFAEELFAQVRSPRPLRPLMTPLTHLRRQLATEAQAENTAARTRFELGTGKTGDSVVLEGSGWTLRISMVRAKVSFSLGMSTDSLDTFDRSLRPRLPTRLRLPPPRCHRSPPSPASSSSRNMPLAAPAPAHDHPSQHLGPFSPRCLPILTTLSVPQSSERFWTASRRVARSKVSTLMSNRTNSERGKTRLRTSSRSCAARQSWVDWSRCGLARRACPSSPSQSRTDSGVLCSHVIHVAHSYPLPSSSATPQLPPILPSVQPTLSLRLPGRPPLQVPGLRHLEGLVREELGRVVSLERQRTKEAPAADGKEEDGAEASGA